jgi:MFS family permease
MFMTQADATIVNVAGPSIHSALGASGAELELVIGGYFVAYAMLLITGARLGEMRGYRRAFLQGLGLFTVASLACGLAPAPEVLIAARVAQGAGAALMVPQVLTGIQLSFEGAERARALSLYAIALAGGAITGQVLGGVVVSADVLGTGWRSIFLLNIPIGAVALVAASSVLPADGKTGPARRLDLAGMGTLGSALLLIVLPLVLGREEHWPMWTWACLIASVPLLAAFVAVERRAAARGATPLVNLHVLARRPISWGLLAQSALVATYYGLLFVLALYVQQGLDAGALRSGLTLVAFIVAFPIRGRIIGRLPERRAPLVAPAGCLILATAYLAVSTSLLSGHHDEALLVALLGLGGFGLGTAYAAILNHLTAAATPRYAADISGVFTTCLQIAGAIGVATFGTAYLGLVDGRDADTATDAFGVITLAFAATALLAFGMACRATLRSGRGEPVPGTG